jgi:hypothetical protein
VSLSQDAMMKLMAYADGEAQGADLVEVERLLAKEPDAARFVEQIAGLGGVVKAGHAARRDEALASFDVLDAVMAKVKDTTPDPAEPAKAPVASLAEARARRQRVTIAAGVAAALALAASVFLFEKPTEEPMAHAPSAPVTAPAHGVVAPPPTEMAATVPGIVVEPIESPGQSVKVIYGPGKNEMSTSVIIWVDEERK